MTASEKAKEYLAAVRVHHAVSAPAEALDIIRALLEENAAWQRSHGRKATAGARLNVKHHNEVTALRGVLALFQKALEAIAENGMDAGRCRDFAAAALARIEKKEEAKKP